jgi:hypothetical protein
MSDLVMLQRLAERAVPPASCAERLEEWHKVKKVVSGGPSRATARPQADAGLPDTIPLN